jgi:hypothetical protein
LLIVALGIVASAFSLALAASTLIRSGNPDLAARIMPIDSLAASGRAEQLMMTDLLNEPKQVAAVARSALRLQPINPTAFQVMGVAATAAGDTQTGRALIVEAQHQSRREAPVQFLLIEDAVRRGDIREALAHYDIILRTQPNSHALLFPTLLDALKEPAIRTALSPYYHTERTWAPQFASYALANSKDLDALVALELEAGGLENPQFAHDQSAGLIARLVQEKRFAAARRVYLAMHGATSQRLVDAGFSGADIDGRFGAIGWQTGTEADASSILAKDAGNRLEMLLSASALTSTKIATKLLYLRPGKYRVDVALSRFEGEDGAAVGVQIRCPALTGDQPVWSEQGRAKMIGGEFVLPAGCDAQYLDIVAIGGSSGSMLDATVRSVTVRPS